MKTWAAEALNTAPDSKNEIHGDKLAKEFGFKGGLVPGVTISAYLLHPVIEKWGIEWLNNGFAKCMITSPLYDKEKFEVISNLKNRKFSDFPIFIVLVYISFCNVLF